MRTRAVKSKKWFRRRNKWLFNKPEGNWPPKLDEKQIEILCDADRATWEDHNLLLPERYMYTLDQVLTYAFQETVNALLDAAVVACGIPAHMLPPKLEEGPM